jgi:NADH-quinone oxidoreductase subunit C
MVIEHIDEQLPGAVQERHDFRGDETIVISKDRFLDVVDLIFKEGFQLLVDLTAVDWPEREGSRFDVVYHWLNLANQDRLRLKVRIGEDEALPSLVPRFKTADWYEREVWDMFGIKFDGHPDLRRLLTWEDFPGHALRKDFPLDGGDPFCTSDTGTPYAGQARSLQG